MPWTHSRPHLLLQAAVRRALVLAAGGVLALALPAVGGGAIDQGAARQEPAAGNTRAVIEVKGLACPFCVFGLEKHLSRLPGAERVDVQLGESEVTVEFAPDAEVTEQQIRKAVADAGFTAGSIEWDPAGEPDASRQNPSGTPESVET